MDKQTTYIRTDDHGTMRVGQTRVSLDSIVGSFEQGHSPETIQQQFPSLTLEQVYGAITYYLAHQPEVTEYLRRQDAQWEKWRSISEQQNSPVVKRLRELKRSGAEQRR